MIAFSVVRALRSVTLVVVEQPAMDHAHLPPRCHDPPPDDVSRPRDPEVSGSALGLHVTQPHPDTLLLNASGENDVTIDHEVRHALRVAKLDAVLSCHTTAADALAPADSS